MATLLANQDSDVPHIGPAHHYLRNLLIVLGLFIMAGLAIAYSLVGGRNDAREVGKLQAFMSAYSEQCDERVANGPTPLMSRLYLHSDAMQAVVDKQTKALAGGADCASVYAAMHAADFPLPAPAK